MKLESLLMFIAGFSASLIGMNLCINKLEHMKFTLNDIYIAILVNFFMFFIYGLFVGNLFLIFIGIFISLCFFLLIRKQVFISKDECIKSIIPHQSTTIFFSEKILEQDLTDNEKEIIKKVIDNQNKDMESLINLLK